MIKPASTYILVILLLYSCADKIQKDKSPLNFRSFEISYSNGWAEGFSLLADSGKAYLAPCHWDSAYSGILPDTIFSLLDSTYRRIFIDSTLKSKKRECYDCPWVVIQVISEKDTARIYQEGDISKELWPVIKSLQTFLDSSNHRKIKSKVLLETRSLMMPPPPPLMMKKVN